MRRQLPDPPNGYLRVDDTAIFPAGDVVYAHPSQIEWSPMDLQSPVSTAPTVYSVAVRSIPKVEW